MQEIDYTPYITAAYASCALILAVLVIDTLWRYTAQKKKLRLLKPDAQKKTKN
jgi:heme exporter protein CcmD